MIMEKAKQRIATRILLERIIYAEVAPTEMIRRFYFLERLQHAVKMNKSPKYRK